METFVSNSSGIQTYNYLHLLVISFSKDWDHCSTSSEDTLRKKEIIIVGLAVVQSVKKKKLNYIIENLLPNLNKIYMKLTF